MGTRNMKEKHEVQVLIDQYTPTLAKKGLRIVFKKRYFENKVGERSRSSGAGSILDELDRMRDCKKEARYHYEKNRYHCIVIAVMPDQAESLPKEDCREYAFVVRKVERPHIGEKPRHTAIQSEKLLKGIEKRLRKLLKKADKKDPRSICQNTVADALRYAILIRYGYKKRILGRSRLFWQAILLAGAVTVVLALMTVAQLCGG